MFHLLSVRENYAIFVVMKRAVLILSIISIAGMAGCSQSVTPSQLIYGAFFVQDPLARAAGRDLPEEANQRFDVGVALQRAEWFDGTPIADHDYPEGAMAFEEDSEATQVTSARINGIALPWYAPNDTATYWCDLYRTSDSILNISGDSMTFSYQGFRGESYSATVGVAPSFGTFTYGDTISASQGFDFHYPNSVPGDTIQVFFYGVDTGTVSKSWSVPDTGGFIIPPHLLSYYPHGYNQYSIQISRTRLQVLTSPQGTRIGIYSRSGTGSILFYTKP